MAGIPDYLPELEVEPFRNLSMEALYALLREQAEAHHDTASAWKRDDGRSLALSEELLRRLMGGRPCPE